MPEMVFTVRWPDGAVEHCYSPSLVVHDHLEAGCSYPLADFVARASTALDVATQRVKEKFGFECTSAAQQKSSILQVAGRFTEGRVEVIAMQTLAPN